MRTIKNVRKKLEELVGDSSFVTDEHIALLLIDYTVVQAVNEILSQNGVLQYA